MYNKIIVVSEGDTSRGPMARAILEELFVGEDMEVTSKGMVVLFPEPANPKCVAICKAKGYDISGHMACQLEEEDFADRTVVFVMSDKQKLQIYEKYKNARNVFALKDFIGESGELGDPYGSDLGDYALFFGRLKYVLEQAREKLHMLSEQNGR